uniref:NADH-ubiquinone oxidoreductase chain 6 n=1 Tax=Hapalogenys analis TaxID=360505 RepID=K4P3W7_9TELE|nr:NADH dehydrogenase subunit 6 [Hapalogenys analis]AFV57332.1 NADH dehydrogenase subunit 6 [Hapalogenys analis]QOH92229.1 NADH dehydrogenase subunit 6 [Hapalogenys analis]UUA63055.1 NADH dehydrogenase subunit 6 [Girella punctata]WPS66092.1 NADH dehydrogenase subunit 6 [Hapalogenys analis]
MFYDTFLFVLGLMLGAVAVASNPSPYYAAFGLVVGAGMGCGVLVSCGGSFLPLMLFLIYLGGMLVVFGYIAALSGELYPKGWGSRSVFASVFMYVGGLALFFAVFGGGWYADSWVVADEFSEFSVFRGDIGGVALMYSLGGWMLVISAWVLLLALFVVLELTRGLSRGALRAV